MTDFTVGEESLRLWQTKQSALLALLVVVLMCFFQLKSSLMLTPSYLLPGCGPESCSWCGLLVGVDYLLSVWTDADHCTFLWVEFYLPGFFPSLQCRQILLEEGRVLAVFDVSIKKSSAKSLASKCFVDSGRSLIKAKKKQPTMDSPQWQAGEYVSYSEDLVPFKRTDCFLWLRKDSIQCNVEFHTL